MATTSAPTINTYISDMLALEQHIETPVQSQIDDADFAKLPVALRVVRGTYQSVQTRISALSARLEAVGGHAGHPAKNAVASVVGAAASAIDKVRKTEVSKALRDDYTALCLASAGYTMLNTTALALHDTITATLAKEHLADIATQIMKISTALPVVVLAELSEMGVEIDPSVSETAQKNSDEAWQEAAQRSQSAGLN